jgi:hypothetical protein
MQELIHDVKRELTVKWCRIYWTIWYSARFHSIDHCWTYTLVLPLLGSGFHGRHFLSIVFLNFHTPQLMGSHNNSSQQLNLSGYFANLLTHQPTNDFLSRVSWCDHVIAAESRSLFAESLFSNDCCILAFPLPLLSNGSTCRIYNARNLFFLIFRFVFNLYQYIQQML